MSKNISLSKKTQLFCWWSGIAFNVLFFAALAPMMGFIPPPDPSWTSEQFVAHIAERSFTFKVAIVLGCIAGMLQIPWTIMIAYHVARMEKGRTPLLAAGCIVGGWVNALFTLVPFVWWGGVIYRMDRNPDVIRFLNDITWLEFVIVWPPFFIFLTCLGTAILNNKADYQILPRWYGFFVLWVALAMTGGGIAPLFFDGPFAWNGLIAWWLVVVMFGTYYLISFPLLRKAVKTEEAHSIAATA